MPEQRNDRQDQQGHLTKDGTAFTHPDRLEHPETGPEAGHQRSSMKLRGGQHLTGRADVVEALSTRVHFFIASSIRRSQFYTA